MNTKDTGPKFNAYKPVYVTDGLTQQVGHHFDNTVQMTPDDITMAKSIIKNLAPNARIKNMQMRLESLQVTTPAIKLHVDAIRSIHAGLENQFNLDQEGLDALQRADELWEKIVVLRDVMPLAQASQKHKEDATRKEAKLRSLQKKKFK